MHQFAMPVRVYVEDTDAGGIVYYVNYLKYMERARTEWFRERGYEKPAMFRDNLMFVVHSLNISYRRPARLDDLLEVTAAVVRTGRTYFEMDQQVVRGDERICVARVKVACVSRDDMKPAAIPDDVRAAALAADRQERSVV
jgi:4-hydroxybenzoyl-CoA thioesterase/acyl-CoA thioester hydrolase